MPKSLRGISESIDSEQLLLSVELTAKLARFDAKLPAVNCLRLPGTIEWERVAARFILSATRPAASFAFAMA